MRALHALAVTPYAKMASVVRTRVKPLPFPTHQQQTTYLQLLLYMFTVSSTGGATSIHQLSIALLVAVTAAFSAMV